MVGWRHIFLGCAFFNFVLGAADQSIATPLAAILLSLEVRAAHDTDSQKRRRQSKQVLCFSVMINLMYNSLRGSAYVFLIWQAATATR